METISENAALHMHILHSDGLYGLSLQTFKMDHIILKKHHIVFLLTAPV